MEKAKKSLYATLITVIVTAVILAAVGLSLSRIMIGATAESEYKIEGDIFTITGSYGNEIDLSGAAIGFFTDSKLNITMRNNGSSAGGKSKGQFTLSDNGAERIVYLNFMTADGNFYIKIVDREKEEYYINCKTSEKTQELYGRLVEGR